jgi:D-lactate dehydrogenase
MKILYIKPSAGEREAASAGLEGHELIFSDDLDSVSESVCDSVEAISVFVNTPLSAESISRFPRLQLIATRSTGFDHVDTEAARAKGIRVVHVPRYGSQTVAEYTFALIFALAKNVFAAYTDMQFKSAVTDLDQYEGCNLMGKTLGVVGTGLIGQRVSAIAAGLGMKVLAYDVAPTEAIQSIVTYVDLDTLLSQSDFVTIHVPGNKHTHHLIHAEKIALLKKSAYLINTARGEVIETHALVTALEEGRIRGVALDVLEGEHYLRKATPEQLSDPVIRQLLEDNRKLIAMDQAIITPHIAFDTREAKEEIMETTIANIKAFARGEIVNEVPA